MNNKVFFVDKMDNLIKNKYNSGIVNGMRWYSFII